MHRAIKAQSARLAGRSRAGLTLVEVGVVLVVVFVLLVMAMSFAQERGGREGARCRVCLNNMRQVGQALISYESNRRQYPGYLNVLIQSNGRPYVDPRTNQRPGVSWVVQLLPNLDRPDLDKDWRTPALGAGGNKPFDPNVRLDFLICPSNPQTTEFGANLAYVVNTGMPDCEGLPDMPSDWADNGVFFDRYTGDTRISEKGKRAIQMVVMSAEVIARGDGLENTIMLSENVDAGMYTDVDEAKLGMVWFGTGNIDTRNDPPNLNPPDDAMRINRSIGLSQMQPADPKVQENPIEYARPSSYHPGGANVIFCDGHGRFISQEIDYYVYCLLMSSNGKRVRVPGSQDVLPNFDREIKDSWIY